MSWVDAADASLPDESVVAFEADGTAIALAKVDGAWHAVETWCTHAECPLSDGWVEAAAIRCPCHGSLFDLATGIETERRKLGRGAHRRVVVPEPPADAAGLFTEPRSRRGRP